MLDVAQNVYNRIITLDRYDCRTYPAELPENGLYFFFEDGENLDTEDELQRVVLKRPVGM